MAARHAATRPARDSLRGGNGQRSDWARGFGALLLLLILLVGIPVALIAATGVPFAHGLPTFRQLADRFRGPDDGRLLLDALVCLAWAGWAAFTVTSVAETVALARHTVAPAIIGLTGLQPAVARLIAAVVLLLPASGAALHLAGGAVQPRPALTAPLRTAAVTTTSPPPVASPATKAVAHRPVVSAVAVSEVLPVYVVGSDPTGERDTLWSIAARHLGDPLRWHDIARLNEGQRQADGAVFTDPNLIRPGWALRLPADATGLTPPKPHTAKSSAFPAEVPKPTRPAPARPLPALTPVPAPQVAPPAQAQSARPGQQPTVNDTQTISPTAPNSSPPGTSPSRGPIPAATPDRRSTLTVPLGPGSDISAALATAVLLSLTLRRLHRRRRYQPRSPQPARLDGHPPLPPALRQLIAHTPAPLTELETADAFLAAVTETRGWDLGVRDGQPVTVSWTDYPVLRMAGDGADGVARAVLACALLDHPGMTEVIMVGSLFDELFPGVARQPGVRQLSGLSVAAERVQLEVISRSRRLADADLPDAAAYRLANPEDPFPGLLVVVDQPLSIHPALARLLTDNAHLDIAALILTAVEPAPAPAGVHDDEGASIAVTADGRPVTVHPAGLAECLARSLLYRLTAVDAAVLFAAADPTGRYDDEDDDDDDGEDSVRNLVGPDFVPEAAVAPVNGVDWKSSVPPASAGEQPPIRVQLLGNGPMRIWLHDVEIVTGLRASGRQLLAWFLLHPQGRTIDAAVTALWPGSTPERVSERFWTAFGSLRSQLADPGTKRVVLSKTAGAYQPQPGQFTVDVWTFQAALQHAAHAADDAATIAALRQAIDTYQGPFVVNADYPWADPIREQLHHAAIDAHAGYAELVAGLGGTDQAVATLERARQLDPYAEDIYRRLMRLHHEAGRPETALQVWKQLCMRLAELDADPDPETSRLYRLIRDRDNRRQPPDRPVS